MIDPTTRYFILARERTRVGLSGRELTLLTLLLFQILMAWMSRLDGTWELANGVGFAQHYGFFTIFIITPLILFLTGYVLQTFVSSIAEIDSYCVTPDDRTRNWIARLSAKHVERLSLNGDTTSILVMIIVAFGLLCVYNISRTIDPIPTYHHDIFDAWAHRRGFFAAKAYVFLALSGVWAVAVFVCLHVTYSMFNILDFLRHHDVFQVNLFHRDNCGGTSRFGNINLAITAVYFCLFSVALAMMGTHGATYLIINAGFVAISVLAIAQTFGAVFAIHRVMSKKKQDCLEDLAAKINERVIRGTGAFPNDLLSYRNHVMGLHTFPYAKGTLAIVNTLRFAPILVAISTIVARAH